MPSPTRFQLAVIGILLALALGGWLLGYLGGEEGMNLFQTGCFKLHSGKQSNWKIECDALTAEDMHTLAILIAERVPAFGSVYGIPRGGERLAIFLKNRTTEGPLLIVDDVLTSGRSMEDARGGREDVIGAVIFARGKCPDWITPLFRFADRG